MAAGRVVGPVLNKAGGDVLDANLSRSDDVLDACGDGDERSEGRKELGYSNGDQRGGGVACNYTASLALPLKNVIP